MLGLRFFQIDPQRTFGRRANLANGTNRRQARSRSVTTRGAAPSSAFAKATADKRGRGSARSLRRAIRSGFSHTSFFSFRDCAKNVDARREAGHDVL